MLVLKARDWPDQYGGRHLGNTHGRRSQTRGAGRGSRGLHHGAVGSTAVTSVIQGLHDSRNPVLGV